VTDDIISNEEINEVAIILAARCPGIIKELVGDLEVELEEKTQFIKIHDYLRNPQVLKISDQNTGV